MQNTSEKIIIIIIIMMNLYKYSRSGSSKDDHYFPFQSTLVAAQNHSKAKIMIRNDILLSFSNFISSITLKHEISKL